MVVPPFLTNERFSDVAMDDLDRMFRRLLQTVRASHPELLTRPFDIGEIYQILIPYRHNRRELEIETNQDYEVALMRLLSGERGYLVGDAQMQDALQRELASPNPDTSAFRAYASSQVSLSPEILRRMDQAPTASPTSGAVGRGATGASSFAPTSLPTRDAGREPARSVADAGNPVSLDEVLREAPARQADPRAPAGATVAVPPKAAPSSTVPSSRAPSQADAGPAVTPRTENVMTNPQRTVTAESIGGTCRYCGGALPTGRRLTFCPHCGQNLTIQNCPACGTELEVGWKYCVTCGRSVGAEEGAPARS